MGGLEGYELSPRDRALWARGYPVGVPGGTYRGQPVDRLVYPPVRHPLSCVEAGMALEFRAALEGAVLPPADEWVARLERAEDPAAELADLQAVAVVFRGVDREFEAAGREAELTGHMRDRLYRALDGIALGLAGKELARAVGPERKKVLPPYDDLARRFREARAWVRAGGEDGGGEGTPTDVTADAPCAGSASG